MICDFSAWVFDKFGDTNSYVNYGRVKDSLGVDKEGFRLEYPLSYEKDTNTFLGIQPIEKIKEWQTLFLKDLREHIAECQKTAEKIQEGLDNP